MRFLFVSGLNGQRLVILSYIFFEIMDYGVRKKVKTHKECSSWSIRKHSYLFESLFTDSGRQSSLLIHVIKGDMGVMGQFGVLYVFLSTVMVHDEGNLGII